MAQDPLFQPLQFGALNLANRVLMPPMTRSRAAQPGDVPTALMAEYYAQRASAGLIVSEGTWISPLGKGYARTPGIHTQAQIDGWRLVTEAVHAAGGRMFAQLWHVGRLSHSSSYQLRAQTLRHFEPSPCKFHLLASARPLEDPDCDS